MSIAGLESAALQAIVTGLVQLLIWLVIRRRMGQQDAEMAAERSNRLRLEAEVRDLRDDRLARVETTAAADEGKRKNIYERIERIEMSYMSKAECDRAHKGQSQRDADFIGAVLKLERVGKDAERAVAWLADLQRDQVALGNQVAALIARVENLEKGE
jgi:cell division protein FtsB